MAWHDVRQVLFHRIGPAARLLLADADPSHNLDDRLLPGINVADVHTEQFGGLGTGRPPQRNQRPVAVRAHLNGRKFENLAS